MKGPVIHPQFRVSVICAKEEERKMQAIDRCVQDLRRRGFQVHDLRNLGYGDDCRAICRDSDVFILVCSPAMKKHGDVYRVMDDPAVQRIMLTKDCIVVLTDRKEENAVPGWIREHMEDRPLTAVPRRYGAWGIDQMGTLLGNILRREEADKMRVMNGEAERGRICPESCSVRRSRKMERFLLYGKAACDYVRVLAAMGRSKDPDWVYPEWIVYEDPDRFMADGEGKVTVKLARLGKRDMDPGSENAGAYSLGQPVDVRVSEELTYGNGSELVRIVSGLLQESEPGTAFREADLSILYERDMETDIPAMDPDAMNSTRRFVTGPVNITIVNRD